MNILFDHQIFRMQRYGGVSRYFFELARHLSREEHVYIFSPVYVNEYLRYTSNAHITGIKVPHLSFSGTIMRGVNEVFSKLLIKKRKEIDIFHETFFSKLDNCPSSAKRILTVYDMITEKFPGFFNNQKKETKIKEYAVHRADHVICISENTRQDLIDILRVPCEKTSVVHLGYSLSCTDPAEDTTIERPFILYVGNREGYKNYEMMLRAYASSKALKDEVSIICFGGGRQTATEKNLVASLNLPHGCITYMSGRDSTLAGLYASARAFVYPSLYEGFGIPPIEAMSFGCPVVCANSGSLPEVVGNAAELFDPSSESDMRNAIEKVVLSSGYAEILVAKGYERTKLFSWENCARGTLAVYRKVLGG